MSLWQRLFGPRQTPKEPQEAPPPSDPKHFCEFIARHGVWLVARDIKGNKISFIDYIDGRGRHVWPLFSTQDNAAIWVSESGVTEVTPFPCLQLTLEGALGTMPAAARIVFDEKSPYERELTLEDLEFLRSLVGTPSVPSPE